MVGFVAAAAVLAFAPRPIPAVPAPVRLEGEVGTTVGSTPSELIVVPAPSIDLSATTTVTVTTIASALSTPIAPTPSTTIAGSTVPAPSSDSPDSADSPDD